jgi:hypothetical protein
VFVFSAKKTRRHLGRQVKPWFVKSNYRQEKAVAAWPGHCAPGVPGRGVPGHDAALRMLPACGSLGRVGHGVSIFSRQASVRAGSAVLMTVPSR